MNSDAVALLALIVSLVALLIALLQVAQQYAATAYDYRRCSARTMGGWSKHTKRVFIPSEIRFEITFAVPHIDIELFDKGNKVPTCCNVISWTGFSSSAWKLIQNIRLCKFIAVRVSFPK